MIFFFETRQISGFPGILTPFVRQVLCLYQRALVVITFRNIEAGL